ncbi:unnamed protein product [Prunus brigantina]
MALGPPDFQGSPGAHRTPRDVRCSSGRWTLPPAEPFPGSAPTAAPPGSRPRFCSDRRALLLIGAWHLPRRPGIGRALKRHPFSGLVDSAGRGRCAPDASNHWLYPIELVHGLRLSEGNFGGNRLLDGSISLSPLYPSRTNDLHVGIAAGLHRVSCGFAPLGHSSPSFGSRRACSHSNPSRKIKVGRRCNPQGDPAGRLPYALRV